MRDPDYKGDDFEIDKELENGPLEDRKCTDVFCCLFFVLFMAAMGGIAIYGYENGQPHKLLAPLDGNDRFCGVDPEVKDFPIIFYFDITTKEILQTGVCVKTCPLKDQDVDCVPTTEVPDCQVKE